MTTVFTGILLLVMAAGFVYLKQKVDRVVSGEEWIRKIRDEIDQLILEMNQTAERNVALLENRVQALQNLLDEADKKLLIMQKESDKSDLSRRVYTHLKKQTIMPQQKDKEDLTPGLFDEITLGSNDSIIESDNKVETTDDSKSLKEQVMTLYEQGFAAEIISQRLGASISEVDLIINLKTGGSL